jgi:release factor glutamine methyltransferase
MPTVGQLLARARPVLAATPFGASPREALLLLGRVLGLSEAQVLARPEADVPNESEQRFSTLLARRLGGEPVAYLVGEKEFFGRPFWVDSRVLIPRPETEHVVEAALAGQLLPGPPSPRILDVGTGSGCLAVTLALEIPRAIVVATDVSLGALAVAAKNARRHGVAARVRLAGLELLAGLDLSHFDLVVSNPPYVDLSEAPALSPEVCNFEPHLALFAPGSGDAVLARLIRQAESVRAGVRLILEMGLGQLEAVTAAGAAAGFEVLSVRDDLAGIPRVVELRRLAGKDP